MKTEKPQISLDGTSFGHAIVSFSIMFHDNDVEIKEKSNGSFV